MTGVKTLHPQVTAEKQAEWALMGAAFSGESAVKKAGEQYLPMPSGFLGAPNPNAAYAKYRGRAQFPEIVAPSVGAMVGIVHDRDAQIEMPDAMAFLWEQATQDGLSLEAFHRRITRNLLVFGRYGVLADAPEAGGDPFLTGYRAGAVINWDSDFFVLDETHMARNGFDWERVERYRVLELIEGRYVQTVYQGGNLDAGEELHPRGIGGRALDYVPFCIANGRDITAEIETPPLIGVARAAVAIYQLNADYRHQLYMSGQETLVAINGDAPSHVGAGACHTMHGTEGLPADLKYVGPACTGIDAHLTAMQDNREAAVTAGARMLERDSNTQESGSARKLRFASETANLMSIALVSCGLLERGLRYIAGMMGLRPDDVVVTPPADLLDHTMTPADAEALVRVWQAGAIGYDTLYDNLQRGGIASSERTVEDELRLLDEREFTGADTGP